MEKAKIFFGVCRFLFDLFRFHMVWAVPYVCLFLGGVKLYVPMTLLNYVVNLMKLEDSKNKVSEKIMLLTSLSKEYNNLSKCRSWICLVNVMKLEDFMKTRMHSSMMRTVHYSGRLWRGGGVSAAGVFLSGGLPDGVPPLNRMTDRQV